MRRSRLWRVEGRLHSEDGARQDHRSILVIADEFPFNDLAARCLLDNWSSRSHTAEILSITPVEDEVLVP